MILCVRDSPMQIGWDSVLIEIHLHKCFFTLKTQRAKINRTKLEGDDTIFDTQITLGWLFTGHPGEPRTYNQYRFLQYYRHRQNCHVKK